MNTSTTSVKFFVEHMRLGDTGEMKTLHLVVRDPSGRIGQQAIGHAIIAAESDEPATPSALHNGLLALASYQAHSPREAVAAMRVLADLGDVDFEEGDFTPRWCQPDQCIAVIDDMLERRRRPFAGPVRAESRADPHGAGRGQQSRLQQTARASSGYTVDPIASGGLMGAPLNCELIRR